MSVRIKQSIPGAFLGEVNAKGYVQIQIIGATLDLRYDMTKAPLKGNCQGVAEVSGSFELVTNRFKQTKSAFIPDSLESFKVNA